jgi:DNA-binding NarL/FixJ family response regulator
VSPPVASFSARPDLRLTRAGPAQQQREREVLSLIAEGHSNSSIAETLVVSTGAVEKHVASIFAKLELPPDDRSHRVLAVLSYLRDES